MRLALSVLAAVAATASLATPLQAARKPADVTWGKPGVSFADYRRDTLECANKTYGLDVSMTPGTAQALSAVNSAGLYDLISDVDVGFGRGGVSYEGGAAGYRQAMAAIDPATVPYRNTTYTSLFRNAARTDVIDQLQLVLDYCLQSRGYQRFRLSAAQRDALHHYRYGTEERARFLHRLSSDPQVLAQANRS